MGVASGCGEQEVGVASGSGWNLWVWLLGVVLRRYIDFLILLIPTPLVSVLFGSSIYIYQRNAPAISSKMGSLRLAPIMLKRRVRVHFTVHIFRIIASFS